MKNQRIFNIFLVNIESLGTLTPAQIQYFCPFIEGLPVSLRAVSTSSPHRKSITFPKTSIKPNA